MNRSVEPRPARLVKLFACTLLTVFAAFLAGCGSASAPVSPNPTPSFVSVTPSSASQNQTVTVAIVGLNTTFAQGQTQATFGAGIAVNGAAANLPGLITVTSPTTATASLVIASTAATGARDVTVTTGSQTVTLKSGFTVQAALIPLTASAGGPYTGLSGRPVQFDGSQSKDPNGLTLTYAWNFGDGTTGTDAQPTHTYAKAGVFTTQLTVTDSANLTASASTTATITTLANPVAVAGGPYTGTTSQTIAFDGSASSDPNASALTYAWTFGDGSTATSAKPTHAYAAAGTYTATLTVTDTYALTASATATVTVTNASKPPTAAAGGPYTAAAGAAIAFNGSASSDPNGQTLTYAWDFGDGTTATGATPSHAYTTAGSYTARLTVTDTSALTASATAAVTITPATSTVLTANPGGPYLGVTGTPITFTGAASSDPKAETLTYAWDFGDGSTATGVAPTHTYTAASAFTVTLTVTNTDAATASATTSATINTILQAVQSGPYTGNVGQSIAFNGVNSTAPGSDPLTYAWTFGDGATATAAQVTHTYTTAGAFAVVLTTTDTTTNLTATSSSTAVITAPPVLTFTTPTQGTLFNTTSINVTGTAGSTVQSVTVDGTPATLTSGVFTATIAVRAGVNILTASGTDASGVTGTASTSVTVDLTPPILSVLSPTNGATVTTQQISVSGMVTDQVTGTVNSNDVTVTLNGQPATVANRSFLFSNLLLVPGVNTLSLVATDKAGNSSQSTVKVTLAPSTAQQHIVILSGDAQTAQINSVLPQPLVVQLVSATGSPMPNRAVTFTVTASDGIVESLPQQAQTLTLNTDTQGKASVLFQLGSRAGLGTNQVSVTSPGFLGGTVFSHTSTASTATYIHEFLGNNQRGIIGQPLAQAFQVIVQDAGGDPIANIPVTYTVSTGDGLFAGQSTTTVNTNADGRAFATLTLGQQEGINNNTVTVDFLNDPNVPVAFYASGFSSGDASKTTVSGIVLDNAGNPVPNATASLLNTSLSTTSDVNGHFLLSAVPVGTVTLLVDGSTTTLAETLPSLSFLLQALPGQNNTLNMPVYLPIIDTASARTVGGSVPVTLTMTSLPGVALTVAPNSVTFPDGSHVGQLTVSQVKSDLIPMPPPNGIVPAFAWTIQPAGTIFSTPVVITIPNTQGLPPGQVQEFYQYDHDLEQFVSVGTLRVSPDGSVLNSDPGFGLTKAGWSGTSSNPPPGSCKNSCDDNNVCTSDTHGKNCSCIHTPKGGGCNSTPPVGPNNCQQPGMCVKGACVTKPKAPGSGCNDNLFCTDPDVCSDDGVCRGVPKPAQQAPFAGLAIQASLQGLTNGIQILVDDAFPKLGLQFGVTVSAAGSTQNVCCESKKNFVPNTNATYTASGSLTTKDIFLPNLSIPFANTGGGLGVSVTFGLQLQGQISLNDAKCQDYKCAQGSFSVGGGISINGGGKAVDPITGVTVAQFQFQTPLQMQVMIANSGDCKSIDATYGIAPVSTVLVEQLPFGPPVTIPIGNIYGGFTLAGQSFTLP